MADDGLLVNFAIPEGFLAPATRIQGGTWRQRQKVRQVIKHRSKKTDDEAADVAEANGKEIRQEGVEVKRRRVEQKPDFRARYRPQGGNSISSSQPPRPSDPNRPFISSLFSSNPSSKIIFDAEPEKKPDQPVEPSNAPLTKEQLNFTTLGLSPTIASHLTNKLAINAPTVIQKEAVPPLLTTDEDAFIQAETGSGKTLAYLLPIVQRIMTLSKDETTVENGIQRTSGLFAIILAPTRELSKQILTVLESLLRCAHEIVPGIVIGGEKKKSEKARLRKGLNILVATPGRLADHLSHTEALDTSAVRWLVLDEGDRLMELGFEDDIKQIVNRLDFRLKKSQGKVMDSLPKKRVTILCSATMRNDVQRLGEISLKEAAHISAGSMPGDVGSELADQETKAATRFSVPSQLKQSYIVVPGKLRLVTLFAHLKRAFIRCKPSTKVMVFTSCADSVDFHFQAFTKAEEIKRDSDEQSSQETEEKENQTSTNGRPKFANKKVSKIKDKIPYQPPAELGTAGISSALSSADHQVTVFRLHGSLAQALRTSTLQAFSKCSTPALLICTDIASRGLDLPNVDRVIEYDPAFSREEHLHRIGRTARAGNDGAATIFLMPSCEEGYVEVLKSERGDLGAVNIRGLTAESVLKAGFPQASQNSGQSRKKSSKHSELQPWEELATDFQMMLERWALADQAVLESARRAFQSHVRAYATHVKDERQWFDMQQLHLGHLAKAFALRDRPGSLNVPGLRATPAKVKSDRKRAGGGARASKRGAGSDVEDGGPDVDMVAARKKMSAMGRAMGGASEFNLA